MATGVETERRLADAFDDAPVHAVLTTRVLKAAPGDLFLRTGSGRAKKKTLPHHVINAAIAMVAGPPKDAAANAVTFGTMTAGKLEAVVRKTTLSNEGGTFSSEEVVTMDMREEITPEAPPTTNRLLSYCEKDAPIKRSFLDPFYPKGQTFLHALEAILLDLAKRSETQDISLGMAPSHPHTSHIEVWLTTRPVRRATILHQLSDKTSFRRVFTSPELEGADPVYGSAGHGRSTFEVIEWPALVAMAHIVHTEQDQPRLPWSEPSPPPAEDGKGDTEESATETTEAAGAPPPTASGIHGPPANQHEAPTKVGQPAYSLSLSPREGAGTLGVSAGLWEGRPSNKQDYPSYEHANPHPALAPVA